MATRLVIFLGVVLAAIAVVGGVLLTTPTAPPVLEDYPALFPSPEFTLFDSTDEVFDEGALEGKIWVAYFFFTSCAGPCPRMTAAMAELAADYAGEEDIHYVAYSVDPDTDTPERLAAYAARYDADTTRWHFLTGPEQEIQRIAVEGFKVGSVDNPVIHSERFALVDRAGDIRGYFDGTDAEAQAELRTVLDAMLEEQH